MSEANDAASGGEHRPSPQRGAASGLDRADPDAPLRGVYPRNRVYEGVTGWESFEPWISRIEAMEADVLLRIAEQVPVDWYGGDTAPLEALVETLLTRRERVRELIAGFRDSDRQPFPNWGRAKSFAIAGQFAPAPEASDAIASKYVM